jgi:hypothetical protein
MDPTASSISSPFVPSREGTSALSGEAIVRRLRKEAPAGAPPRTADIAASPEKGFSRLLHKRAFLIIALLFALGGVGRLPLPGQSRRAACQT